MTKPELIEFVAAECEVSKVLAASAVAAVFIAMRDSIDQEGRFAWRGFGTFVVRKRKARKGANPNTHKPMKIPARKVVRFRASFVP